MNFKIIAEFWQDIGILINPEWRSKLEERRDNIIIEKYSHFAGLEIGSCQNFGEVNITF